MSESLGILEGLTSIQSSLGPKETMDRLENEIRANGMEVFARIDHAAGATKVGMTLAPTEVASIAIFAHPRAGWGREPVSVAGNPSADSRWRLALDRAEKVSEASRTLNFTSLPSD